MSADGMRVDADRGDAERPAQRRGRAHLPPAVDGSVRAGRNARTARRGRRAARPVLGARPDRQIRSAPPHREPGRFRDRRWRAGRPGTAPAVPGRGQHPSRPGDGARRHADAVHRHGWGRHRDRCAHRRGVGMARRPRRLPAVAAAGAGTVEPAAQGNDRPGHRGRGRRRQGGSRVDGRADGRRAGAPTPHTGLPVAHRRVLLRLPGGSSRWWRRSPDRRSRSGSGTSRSTCPPASGCRPPSRSCSVGSACAGSPSVRHGRPGETTCPVPLFTVQKRRHLITVCVCSGETG